MKMAVESLVFVILSVLAPFIFSAFISLIIHICEKCNQCDNNIQINHVNTNINNVHPDEYLPKYSIHPIDFDEFPPEYSIIIN